MTKKDVANVLGKIAFHTLQISNPEQSLDFYRNKLGMALISESKQQTKKGLEYSFVLGFQTPENELTNTYLELVYQEGKRAKVETTDPNQKDGYWKIGITLEDVDLGRDSLLAAGIGVSEPRQFRDIGYLCHLADPDGHSIELLQHRFAENHTRLEPQPQYKLMSRPTFGQITLRINDPEKSLRFYQEGFGMRLLSRQIVEPYKFTLYFLAYTNDKLPFDDIDHVGNREWLWQRPYTTLELQHVWGTETDKSVYRTGAETGFIGMGFATPNNGRTVEKCTAVGATFNDNIVFDPDHYQIRLIETGA
ncbi:MAG: VOC family protein [Anaerolineae bacterium]